MESSALLDKLEDDLLRRKEGTTRNGFRKIATSVALALVVGVVAAVGVVALVSFVVDRVSEQPDSPSTLESTSTHLSSASSAIPVEEMSALKKSYLQGEEALSTDCFGWPSDDFSKKNSVLGKYGQQPFITKRTGDPAVQFTLKDVNGDEVKLSKLIAEKPVVMIFGMWTCPVTHATLDHERELIKTFEDDVHFLHVYSVDPHPESPEKNPDLGITWEFDYSNITRPKTYHGRKELAKKKLEEWNLSPARLVVDEIHPLRNNPLWCTYGPSPRSAYLIRKDGIIELAQTWFDGTNYDFMAMNGEMKKAVARVVNDNFEAPPAGTYGEPRYVN